MSAAVPALSTIASVLAALGVAAAADMRFGTPSAETQVIAAQYGANHNPVATGEIFAGERLSVSRAANRMFYAPVRVNGRSAKFLIDTGATTLVLSRADANALGIDTDILAPRQTMRTVAGETPVSFARIDQVELAGRTFENVDAAIVEGGMGAPLLGQTLLAQFASLTIDGDVLTIE